MKMATKLFLQKCSLCAATVRQFRQLQPTLSRWYQTHQSEDQQTADVVISGGGMVGAAMACALGECVFKTKMTC